jgi:hypothetical protein
MCFLKMVIVKNGMIFGVFMTEMTGMKVGMNLKIKQNETISYNSRFKKN